jgi:hypothetical protein
MHNRLFCLRNRLCIDRNLFSKKKNNFCKGELFSDLPPGPTSLPMLQVVTRAAILRKSNPENHRSNSRLGNRLVAMGDRGGKNKLFFIHPQAF